MPPRKAPLAKVRPRGDAEDIAAVQDDSKRQKTAAGAAPAKPVAHAASSLGVTRASAGSSAPSTPGTQANSAAAGGGVVTASGARQPFLNLRQPPPLYPVIDLPIWPESYITPVQSIIDKNRQLHDWYSYSGYNVQDGVKHSAMGQSSGKPQLSHQQKSASSQPAAAPRSIRVGRYTDKFFRQRYVRTVADELPPTVLNQMPTELLKAGRLTQRDARKRIASGYSSAMYSMLGTKSLTAELQRLSTDANGDAEKGQSNADGTSAQGNKDEDEHLLDGMELADESDDELEGDYGVGYDDNDEDDYDAFGEDEEDVM